MNDWIPCEKELPPLGVVVLMWNPVANRFALATRYEQYWAVAASCSGGIKISPPERAVNLKYWQHLPFPPISEKAKADIKELLEVPDES
jgi:hypothetical protein